MQISHKKCVSGFKTDTLSNRERDKLSFSYLKIKWQDLKFISRKK